MAKIFLKKTWQWKSTQGPVQICVDRSSHDKMQESLL